ncbi:T6SS phospholipase effector Tle1-like catalytic domain-containing protein [Myroides sp. TSA_177.3]|uniref:T6SS phospholipase effector Tle1-like catalytic domain-containing protein n=1 Tax=Myroides sp. TSA_177.3 TaxID=3415650 RepID=UPI00404664A2
MKDDQVRATAKAAVFFDGTGNNRTNSRRDPEKFGGLTNINRLFEACAVADRVYIEGIGTRDGSDDSDWAKGTGNNPPGKSGFSYDDKLEKALDFLKAYKRLHSTDNIELVIYGFSRGATLARDFAKQALASGNVRIRFLGIYDTVMSLIRVIDSYPKIHFTDGEMEKIDQILHLTAIQETRKYFPLTSIQVKSRETNRVAIENYYTSKVKEIFVPGAHADVGGGYLEKEEGVYLNKRSESFETADQELTLMINSMKDSVKCNEQLIWKELLKDVVISNGTESRLSSGRGTIKVDLPLVYFEVMASYSNFFMNEAIFDDSNIAYDQELKIVKDDILTYIEANQEGSKLCFNYATFAKFTHISAFYEKMINSDGTVNDWLNIFDPEQLVAEIERVKHEHPNEDFSSFNEDVITEAFNLALINPNVPNNNQWARNEIFG